MLSQKTITAILELQGQYPKKRSALLPALHLAQAEIGYLPLEVQQEIAALFEITANEVHAVVTFYDMLFEKPVGKHIIRVCKNVSCMLRGSDEILENLCCKLNIKPGGTNVDGQFTVIPTECLAACDRAPMLLLDEEVIGPVHKDDLDGILKQASEMIRPLVKDVDDG